MRKQGERLFGDCFRLPGALRHVAGQFGAAVFGGASTGGTGTGSGAGVGSGGGTGAGFANGSASATFCGGA